MSKFPSLMKFPQNGPCRTSCDRAYPEPYDFLLEMSCEKQRFLTITSQGFLNDNALYYFAAAHLIIPKYFHKVEVNPINGKVLSISPDPVGEEINGMFAVGLREPENMELFEFWDQNALFKRGDNNCGVPTFSKVRDRQNVSKNTGGFITNAHQLFFKFNNHYFTPIILSNASICYHIFEHEKKITKWVKKFNSGKEYEVAINSALDFNNILGIPITRKVKLHEIKKKKA